MCGPSVQACGQADLSGARLGDCGADQALNPLVTPAGNGDECVVVFAQDIMGILWLQNIPEKVWLQMLQPELRRMAKELDFGLSFSKQPAVMNHHRLDLKLYFIWHNRYEVRMEPWDSLKRLIEENDNRYVGHPMQVEWGVKSTAETTARPSHNF